MAKSKVSELDSFKDKSEAELNAMLTSDQIELGSDSDNSRFIEFSKLAPGSKEREAFLAGTASVDGVVPLPTLDTDPAPEAPAVAPSVSATAEKVTEAAGNFAGYSSLDELVQKFDDTRKQLEESVNRHRSSNGRIGAENARLKQELESLRSMVQQKQAPVASAAEVSDETPSMPTPPIPPNPEDFEDGTLDDKYTKAFSSYAKNMASYAKEIENYNTKMRSFDSVVRKRMEPDFSEVRSLRDQLQNKERESSNAQAWDGLWSDASKIQDQYGLKTSVSLKLINDFTAQANDASGSPEDRAAAERFLGSLPPADIAAFDKLSKAMNSFYDFSGGTPKKQYRTFEGFLYENNMADMFKPAQPTPIAMPVQVPPVTQQYAQAMPASAVGSSDVSTRGGYSTQSEMEKSYHQLADELLRDPGGFTRNEEKMKQLNDLEARFGLPSKK